VGVKKEIKLQNNNIKYAKNLRKNVTDTEKYLWKHLRGKKLEGYKFRRQHPIGKYIVDFVNLERKIIIELDGGQHLENKKDKLRDIWLEEQGYEILRFWDNEVFNNVEGVLEVIREKLLSPSP
jgi:very-short-patch-repair endonuclease